MRIICPACAAVYEVPAALLGDTPRALRCARCGNEWVPHAEPAAQAQPDTTPAAAAAPPAPEQKAIPVPPESRVPLARVPATPVPSVPPPPGDPMLSIFPPLVERQRRRRERASALAWALTVLTLAALVGAAYVWRADVQAAWPPSQRAYAAIGLR